MRLFISKYRKLPSDLSSGRIGDQEIHTCVPIYGRSLPNSSTFYHDNDENWYDFTIPPSPPTVSPPFTIPRDLSRLL